MYRSCVILFAALLIVAVCIPFLSVQAAGIDQLATERFVYCYLTEKMGLNTAAASGIMANIELESGFCSDIIGDGGTSIGLCQWHNGRFSALVAFCGSQNLDYRTVQGQLEYLQYELRTRYPGLIKQLKSIENTPQGAYYAGHLWCISFERPEDMERKAVTRGNLAQFKYFNRYSNFITVPEPEKVLEYLETHEPEPVFAPALEVVSAEDTQADKPDRQEDSKNNKNRPEPKIKFVPYKAHHHSAQKQSENIFLGISVGFCFVILGDGSTGKKISAKNIEMLNNENT